MRGNGQQGFTLAELMIVVVIIAVLATLAVYGVQGYIRTSRTAETTSVITSIKAAQEAYREETFTYLDVSEDDYDNRYPDGAPDGLTRFAWGATTSTAGKRFAALGVRPSGPTLFGYACVAGNPNETPEAPVDVKSFNFTTVAATEPFYVIQAFGDQDDDGVFSVFVASSFTNEVYYERKNE